MASLDGTECKDAMGRPVKIQVERPKGFWVRYETVAPESYERWSGKMTWVPSHQIILPGSAMESVI